MNLRATGAGPGFRMAVLADASPRIAGSCLAWIGARPRVRGLEDIGVSVGLLIADGSSHQHRIWTVKERSNAATSAVSWLATIPSTLALGALTPLFRNAASV